VKAQTVFRRNTLNRLRERIPRCLRRGKRPYIKIVKFLAVKTPRGLPRGVFNSNDLYKNRGLCVQTTENPDPSYLRTSRTGVDEDEKRHRLT